MNCTYTVNHKKVTVPMCHSIGKFRSIFRIFALFKQEKNLNMYEKYPPHLNIGLNVTL